MGLLILQFVILGFVFFFHLTVVVDSRGDVNVPGPPVFVISPPPPPPPPPPPSPPPPSPPPPPPPLSGSPPPPPPSKPIQNHYSPSPPHLRKNGTSSGGQSNHKPNVHTKGRNRSKKARRKEKINAGKMIGLLFIGIGGVLQVFVVGFLVFKRQQLLKM